MTERKSVVSRFYPPFVPTGRQVRDETRRWFSPLRAMGNSQPDAGITYTVSLYPGNTASGTALTEWRQLLPGQKITDDLKWVEKYLGQLHASMRALDAQDAAVVYLEESIEYLADGIMACNPERVRVEIMPPAPGTIGMLWSFLALAKPGWKARIGADYILRDNGRALNHAARLNNYRWMRCPSILDYDGSGMFVYRPACGVVSTSQTVPDIAHVLAEYVETIHETYPVECTVMKPLPTRQNPWGYGLDEQFLSRWAYEDMRQARTVALVLKRLMHPLLQVDLSECEYTTVWWI